jgi:integrase
MLLEHPEIVARETGIPQLARLAEMPLPRDPITLGNLIEAYAQHADAGDAAKRKVREAWDTFTGLVTVRTLPEVTVERFTAYGDAINAKGWCSEYVADNFGRVRRVIRFGLRRGMDAGQIRSALDRAAVLAAPKRKKSYSPSPIKVADFQRLLTAAGDDESMTAALLLSLNACLYAAELLDVEWDDLDLEVGTYLSDRAKTGIIRAAALWPRTIAALKRVPCTPGKVFKSSRGDAYHPNSFRKLFATLRKVAKVPASIEYNSIRDGAYTAAVASGVPEQLARVMAGHKAPGLADHYIARNPRMTEPACQAVEQVYFPKPSPV